MDKSPEKLKAFYEEIVSSKAYNAFYKKFPLNLFWANDNMSQMREIIKKAKTLNELLHGADKTFMFSVNETNKTNQLAVEWILNCQKQSYDLDIFTFNKEYQESKHSFSKNNVLVRNRRLNPDYLRCFLMANRIKKILFQHTNKINRVLEVGAGSGHLARVLMQLVNIKQYVIIDIPETLAFSYSFLTLNFPGKKIVLFNKKTSKREITEAQIILVPAPYVEDFPVKNYDLFVNTASMGEMRFESVRFWMNLVQNKYKVKKLFTLNRFLNTIKLPDHAWRLCENESSLNYDTKWDFASWELEPLYTRCPYVDTQIARYVEIFALRQNKNQLINSSKTNLTHEDIMNQDWYRFYNKDNTMTFLDASASHDYSKNGTLFSLWNLNRLTKYKNIKFLILYLQYLLFLNKRKDIYFEELFWLLGCAESVIKSNGESGKVGFFNLFFKKKLDLNSKFISDLSDRIQQNLKDTNPVKFFSWCESNYVFYQGLIYRIPINKGHVDLRKTKSLYLFDKRIGFAHSNSPLDKEEMLTN